MKAPWKGALRTHPAGMSLVDIVDASGSPVAIDVPGDRAEALVHRANAYDVVREIVDDYKDAPCFAELLGEVDDEQHCGCPVCGMRAIRAALASPEKESTDV